MSDTFRRPGDNDNPTPDDLAAILEDEDFDGAGFWVQQNYERLSAEDKAAVRELLAAEDPSDVETPLAIIGVVQEGHPAATAGEVVQEDAAEQQAQYDAAVQQATNMLQGQEPGGPGVSRPNLEHLVESLVPTGLSPAETDDWVNQVVSEATQNYIESRKEEHQAQGVPEQEAGVLAQNELGQIFYESDLPTWILSAFGGVPTPEQQQRAVEYYNDLFNTSYSDFTTLAAEALTEDTDLNRNLLSSAAAATEPVTSYDIEIPFVEGAQKYHLTQDEREAFEDAGWDMDGITRLVRLANLYPGFDPSTGKNRTPDMAGLAMLARSMGVGDTLAQQTARQQEIEQLQAELDALPGQHPANRAEFEAREARMQYLRNRIESLHRDQGIREEHNPELNSFLVAKNNYGRGLDMYGQNQTLAFIYARDPGLAARINRTGGDPTKLSLADSERATQMLMDAGVINRSKTWAGRLGLRSGDNVLRQFGDYFAATQGGGGGGGGGGGATVRRIIDPVAVKEQVTRLWQALFRSEPDPGVIKAFTESLQAQLDKAPEGLNFDVGARIQEWLHGQPDYASLYGKKSAGTTDEEWQGQFVAAQQSILGSELTDDQAVLAGMKQGDYQTTIGAAAASKQAVGNSTWLGRLARAGQITAELT